MLNQLKDNAVQWLKDLIQIPSFSREEKLTGDYLQEILKQYGYLTQRSNNNVWAISKVWDPKMPTVLLCSHHDTVKPAANWSHDPFKVQEEEGKIIGLGSNDAGGSLVALLATFLYFDDQPNQPYNLIFAGVAEEEISGKNGVTSILDSIPAFDLAIIGEPTKMQMAVAEKGLMVIDAVVEGKSGHAARNEGINAIYLAFKEIERIRNLRFPKTSSMLGAVKLTVTQIMAGTQHNVVPDTCSFVIDVRTNECYTNEEAFNFIKSQVSCQLKPRSFRLNSSQIELSHPIVNRGLSMGLSYFGSPTLSDQALISRPTIKIGCGDSSRSHTADEFIFQEEIHNGIDIYIQLLDQLQLKKHE